MTRLHPMPFGAQVLADGRTRFRLWAPAARDVAIAIEAPAPRLLPMNARDDGWFEAIIDAPAGTRYRYRVDGATGVPDPASRRNPDGVHGASEVIDPHDYDWQDVHWRGRPWHEAVIYELHVGTFTPEGTFGAAAARLDYLAALGVTAIELMPLAAFAGARGWGYDGVLPFAPHAAYGTPVDLKRFVDAAHARGLMVLLDVVYNHFGPDGNYLATTAPWFFHRDASTPWGGAIGFDGPHSAPVRDFFTHNALYWLVEYNLDGLRLDAVHAIVDRSSPSFLASLAAEARAACPGREIHLVLEDDANRASFARPDRVNGARYDALWDDDVHHALHVLVTGETGGYYADAARDPLARLGRCLTEGFADQGEPSPMRGGAPRGEPSSGLPPRAFVTYLQNHDQVGNRAGGERIFALASARRVEAALAIVLLAPSIPLLFMGDEFAAATPFLYFCDVDRALADAIREGRRREFAAHGAAPSSLADPDDPATFARSRLDWTSLASPAHERALAWTTALLDKRRRFVTPLVATLGGSAAAWQRLGERALRVTWRAPQATLWMLANLGDDAVAVERPRGTRVHPHDDVAADGMLPPWQVVVGVDARSP
jgi:malto-oligosyltrehalose trehalohydrolase